MLLGVEWSAGAGRRGREFVRGCSAAYECCCDRGFRCRSRFRWAKFCGRKSATWRSARRHHVAEAARSSARGPGARRELFAARTSPAGWCAGSALEHRARETGPVCALAPARAALTTAATARGSRGSSRCGGPWLAAINGAEPCHRACSHGNGPGNSPCACIHGARSGRLATAPAAWCATARRRATTAGACGASPWCHTTTSMGAASATSTGSNYDAASTAMGDAADAARADAARAACNAAAATALGVASYWLRLAHLQRDVWSRPWAKCRCWFPAGEISSYG
mmetsp:Transcript_22796/g.56745  ORF Transcript_22796/g.56745 Transcript_22796/m.56745 type:complete len:283 (-) Transcript_22796:296-1144(-)